MRARLVRLAEIKETIAEIRAETHLDEWEKEAADLKTEIDDLVIQLGGYESDQIKLTRVQGFSRKWNVDKLEKMLPRATFRKIVKIEVDKDKLDQEVRAGKIDDEKIAPALEERPNAAYVKWTPKSDKSSAEKEAASLAEKLK